MLIFRRIALLLAWSLAAAPAWASSEEGWPREVTGDPSAGTRFVDDATCSECHAQQQAEWSGSHHHQAMQPASAKTVLGDFDDATFTHFGLTSRFFSSGGKFFVNTDGPDGRLSDFEIAYTFGVAPLQQYLIALPSGRLQGTVKLTSLRSDLAHGH